MLRTRPAGPGHPRLFRFSSRQVLVVQFDLPRVLDGHLIFQSLLHLHAVLGRQGHVPAAVLRFAKLAVLEMSHARLMLVAFASDLLRRFDQFTCFPHALRLGLRHGLPGLGQRLHGVSLALVSRPLMALVQLMSSLVHRLVRLGHFILRLFRQAGHVGLSVRLLRQRLLFRRLLLQLLLPGVLRLLRHERLRLFQAVHLLRHVLHGRLGINLRQFLHRSAFNLLQSLDRLLLLLRGLLRLLLSQVLRGALHRLVGLLHGLMGGLSRMGLPFMRLAFVRLAFMRLAFVRLAFVRLAFVRLTFVRLPLVRLALVGLSFVRLAFMGLTLVGLTLVGLTLVGLALVGFCFVRLAFVRLTLVRFSFVRLTLVGLAFMRLVLGHFLFQLVGLVSQFLLPRRQALRMVGRRLVGRVFEVLLLAAQVFDLVKLLSQLRRFFLLFMCAGEMLFRALDGFFKRLQHLFLVLLRLFGLVGGDLLLRLMGVLLRGFERAVFVLQAVQAPWRLHPGL